MDEGLARMVTNTYDSSKNNTTHKYDKAGVKPAKSKIKEKKKEK